VLILHEVGEAMAEPMLGPAWRDMLMSFSSRRAIFLARSVRDNLADSLSTLPELIRQQQSCSLHFYFANLEGLRRTLSPQLVAAYEYWRDSGDMGRLGAAVHAGKAHWQSVAKQLLESWMKNPQEAEAMMDKYMEEHKPLAL
jgi:hypothetical protein